MGRSLTISIVNTGQWPWLRHCLASLRNHPYTRGECETVVLDNSSGDGSVAAIRMAFPEVRVIEQHERHGFGANHNRVAATSDADLLFILNPDAVVTGATLDALSEGFDLGSDVVITAGPIRNDDGSTWPNPRPFPTPLTALGQAVGLHRIRPPERPTSRRTFQDGWVSGCAFMVDRRRFQQVGGFDERFFLYSEEVDLMKRLIEMGWTIAWLPAPAVEHVGRTTERTGGETASVDRGMLRTVTQYERSAIAYMRKHHGRGGAVVFRSALALGAALRATAAATPVVWRELDPKGVRANTVAYHRRRLAVALRPASGTSIADAARDLHTT